MSDIEGGPVLPGPLARRPPPWRDVRFLRVAGQAVFVVALAAVFAYLYANLVTNLQRQRIPTDFAYLARPAGISISGSSFRASGSVADALRVGVLNTALVSFVGIGLASVLGTLIGIARLSTNWLVSRAAAVYVEAVRNVPVLVFIVFMFTVVTVRLPSLRAPLRGPGFLLSNAGLWLPWLRSDEGSGPFWAVVAAAVVAAWAVRRWRVRRFDATGRPHHRGRWAAGAFAVIVAIGYLALGGPVQPSLPALEGRRVVGGVRLLDTYLALLTALVVYTSSHVAEIVRGSIQSVAKGQTEAATALGLRPSQRLRLVVLPQAFRVAVPPVANQYLNLTKNSSLAVKIGYAEVAALTGILIAQQNPAPQSILVLMLVYLAFSLGIAAVTNLVNRRLAISER